MKWKGSESRDFKFRPVHRTRVPARRAPGPRASFTFLEGQSSHPDIFDADTESHQRNTKNKEEKEVSGNHSEVFGSLVPSETVSGSPVPSLGLEALLEPVRDSSCHTPSTDVVAPRRTPMGKGEGRGEGSF